LSFKTLEVLHFTNLRLPLQSSISGTEFVSLVQTLFNHPCD